MKIYFIRHGTTVYNKEDRLQGHSNSELTKEGLEQADKFANFISSKKIKNIFVSPLKRALKTAEIISNKINISPIIIDNLKETCYGSWEEKKKSELKTLPAWTQRTLNKYNFVHPGEFNGVEGESYSQSYEKVKLFLNSLTRDSLVISHLGIIRNVRKFFEQVSDQDAVSFTPYNNQIYIVEINKEKFISSSIKTI